MESMKDSATNGVITVGKRRMALKSYADIIFGVVESSAHSRAAETRLLQNKIRHVQISYHASKDWCSLFENKVFSLIPNDPNGFPFIGELPNGGTPFHIGCAHVEMPFVLPLKTEEEKEEGQIDKKYLIRDDKVLSKFKVETL